MKMFCVVAAAILMLGIGCVKGDDVRVKAIAISVSDLSNPFFVEVAKSVQQRARQVLGDQVQVIVRSNAYDIDRQFQQIDDFIEQEVDLIILVAPDAHKIEAAVRKAQRAGVKVIAVDVNADGADATVTTDNVQAGEIACEYIAGKLAGKGNVVIINGPPVSSVLDRVAGCKSVLNNFSDIQLLSENISGSGSFEGGMEAMATLLEFYDDIDAVFAINDPTASGADTAVRQSGNKDLFIVSVDGSPLAMSEFRKHNPRWLVSAAQFPRQMAWDAVDIGLELLQGCQLKVTTRLIPAALVSADNVNDFQGWSVTGF
jgi:ribose transport system substrate-binding protein